MKLFPYLLSCLLLFPLAEATAAADAYALIQKYKPDTLADLLIESDIQYRIESKQAFQPLNLGAKIDTLPPVSVYLKSMSKTGLPVVMVEEPGSLLKNMFKVAEKALEKKKFWKAADLYQSAVKADKNFFKAYTNLGYCYLKLKKLDKAVSTLERALQINSIDFQAYQYLAEAHELKNNPVKAEEMIASAYMLAKHNPEVLAAVKRILRKNKKVLKTDRLLIPGNYARAGETVTVYIKESDMDSWSMLLQTLAAWDHELIFQPHNKAGGMEKYKHALLNNAIHVRSRVRKGKHVSGDAKLLADLIYDQKMLDPIAYWEIGASRKNDVIQRLPEKTKKGIVAYIQQWVFVPAR